ncbi:MAG TPA: hypothetical protein VL404_06555 [Candidatus Eisenbacteria bacterium]|nr:hypothetical protein [Candidatus Eisenbacteria bacterium]
MRKTRKAVRVVAALLVNAFFLNEAAMAGTIQPPADLALSASVPTAFRFPHSVALIEDSYRPTRNDKTVYLVRDAHTNDSCQLNTAAALDIIFKKEKIKFVFLEAGTGDDSLTFARVLGTPARREKVALSYLKQGQVSGSEYLDLTSDHDFRLWGVEDKDLYWESLAVYRGIASGRARFEAYLEEISAAVEALKPRVLNRALLTLDARRAAFSREELSSVEYAGILSGAASENGVSLAAYPHLRQLKNLKSLEDGIDFKAANLEQEKLLAGLGEAQLKSLLASAGSRSPFRISSRDRQEEKAFYALLEEKAGGLEGYPELGKFLRYLRAGEELDPKSVVREMSALEERLYAALAVTADEADLCRADRSVRRLRSLLELTMTPEDFAAWRADSAEFGVVPLTGFVNRKIMDLKSRYEKAVFLDPEFDAFVKQAERFYELTYRRDRAFARNISAKMDAERQTKAVFVAGGYHSPNLTSIFKESGISYVLITPQVLHETNRARYERILLGQKPPAGDTAGAADKKGILPLRERPILQEVVARLQTDHRRPANELGDLIQGGQGGVPPVPPAEGARLASFQARRWNALKALTAAVLLSSPLPVTGQNEPAPQKPEIVAPRAEDPLADWQRVIRRFDPAAEFPFGRVPDGAPAIVNAPAAAPSAEAGTGTPLPREERPVRTPDRFARPKDTETAPFETSDGQRRVELYGGDSFVARLTLRAGALDLLITRFDRELAVRYVRDERLSLTETRDGEVLGRAEWMRSDRDYFAAVALAAALLESLVIGLVLRQGEPRTLLDARRTLAQEPPPGGTDGAQGARLSSKNNFTPLGFDTLEKRIVAATVQAPVSDIVHVSYLEQAPIDVEPSSPAPAALRSDSTLQAALSAPQTQTHTEDRVVIRKSNTLDGHFFQSPVVVSREETFRENGASVSVLTTFGFDAAGNPTESVTRTVGGELQSSSFKTTFYTSPYGQQIDRVVTEDKTFGAGRFPSSDTIKTQSFTYRPVYGSGRGPSLTPPVAVETTEVKSRQGVLESRAVKTYVFDASGRAAGYHVDETARIAQSYNYGALAFTRDAVYTLNGQGQITQSAVTSLFPTPIGTLKEVDVERLEYATGAFAYDLSKKTELHQAPSETQPSLSKETRYASQNDAYGVPQRPEIVSVKTFDHGRQTGSYTVGYVYTRALSETRNTDRATLDSQGRLSELSRAFPDTGNEFKVTYRYEPGVVTRTQFTKTTSPYAGVSTQTITARRVFQNGRLVSETIRTEGTGYLGTTVNETKTYRYNAQGALTGTSSRSAIEGVLSRDLNHNGVIEGNEGIPAVFVRQTEGRVLRSDAQGRPLEIVETQRYFAETPAGSVIENFTTLQTVRQFGYADDKTTEKTWMSLVASGQESQLPAPARVLLTPPDRVTVSRKIGGQEATLSETLFEKGTDVPVDVTVNAVEVSNPVVGNFDTGFFLADEFSYRAARTGADLVVSRARPSSGEVFTVNRATHVITLQAGYGGTHVFDTREPAYNNEIDKIEFIAGREREYFLAQGAAGAARVRELDSLIAEVESFRSDSGNFLINYELNAAPPIPSYTSGLLAIERGDARLYLRDSGAKREYEFNRTTKALTYRYGQFFPDHEEVLNPGTAAYDARLDEALAQARQGRAYFLAVPDAARAAQIQTVIAELESYRAAITDISVRVGDFNVRITRGLFDADSIIVIRTKGRSSSGGAVPFKQTYVYLPSNRTILFTQEESGSETRRVTYQPGTAAYDTAIGVLSGDIRQALRTQTGDREQGQLYAVLADLTTQYRTSSARKDAQGNLTEIRETGLPSPNENVTAVTRSGRTVTQVQSIVSENAYAGSTVRSTQRTVTVDEYDAQGRLLRKSVSVTGTGFLGSEVPVTTVTAYRYDAQGRLTGSTETRTVPVGYPSDLNGDGTISIPGELLPSNAVTVTESTVVRRDAQGRPLVTQATARETFYHRETGRKLAEGAVSRIVFTARYDADKTVTERRYQTVGAGQENRLKSFDEIAAQNPVEAITTQKVGDLSIELRRESFVQPNPGSGEALPYVASRSVHAYEITSTPAFPGETFQASNGTVDAYLRERRFGSSGGGVSVLNDILVLRDHRTGQVIREVNLYEFVYFPAFVQPGGIRFTPDGRFLTAAFDRNENAPAPQSAHFLVLNAQNGAKVADFDLFGIKSRQVTELRNDSVVLSYQAATILNPNGTAPRTDTFTFVGAAGKVLAVSGSTQVILEKVKEPGTATYPFITENIALRDTATGAVTRTALNRYQDIPPALSAALDRAQAAQFAPGRKHVLVTSAFNSPLAAAERDNAVVLEAATGRVKVDVAAAVGSDIQIVRIVRLDARSLTLTYRTVTAGYQLGPETTRTFAFERETPLPSSYSAVFPGFKLDRQGNVITLISGYGRTSTGIDIYTLDLDLNTVRGQSLGGTYTYDPRTTRAEYFEIMRRLPPVGEAALPNETDPGRRAILESFLSSVGDMIRRAEATRPLPPAPHDKPAPTEKPQTPSAEKPQTPPAKEPAKTPAAMGPAPLQGALSGSFFASGRVIDFPPIQVPAAPDARARIFAELAGTPRPLRAPDAFSGGSGEIRPEAAFAALWRQASPELSGLIARLLASPGVEFSSGRTVEGNTQIEARLNGRLIASVELDASGNVVRVDGRPVTGPRQAQEKLSEQIRRILRALRLVPAADVFATDRLLAATDLFNGLDFTSIDVDAREDLFAGAFLIAGLASAEKTREEKKKEGEKKPGPAGARLAEDALGKFSEPDTLALTAFVLEVFRAQELKTSRSELALRLSREVSAVFSIRQGPAGQVELFARGDDRALLSIADARGELQRLHDRFKEADRDRLTTQGALALLAAAAMRAQVSLAEIKEPAAPLGLEVPVDAMNAIADTAEFKAQTQLLFAQIAKKHENPRYRKGTTFFLVGLDKLTEARRSIVRATALQAVSAIRDGAFIREGAAGADFQGVVVKMFDPSDGRAAARGDARTIHLPVGGFDDEALYGWSELFDTASAAGSFFSGYFDASRNTIRYAEVETGKFPEGLFQYYKTRAENPPQGPEVLVRIFSGLAGQKELVSYRFLLPVIRRIPVNLLISTAEHMLRAVGVAA